MRRKKRAAGVVIVLMALALVLVLTRRWSQAGTEEDTIREGTPAPAASLVPTESEASEQEPGAAGPEEPVQTEEPTHEHVWDGESGICLICGYACPHERHDAENAVCLQCGVLCRHRFGAAGVCDGCGMAAPLYTEDLPERYFAPAEHPGQVLHRTVTDKEGGEHRIAVWLPYDYNANGHNNLVLLIHGDHGSCDDWMDNERQSSRGKIRMCWIYDHLTEERLCPPFIVASMDNAGMEDPDYGERLIEETLLPYLSREFGTWMTGSSPEKIAAAREHIAIGGMSRGSLYSYSVGMDRCFDVAANFCCFSNGYEPSLAERLNDEEYGDLPIRCYVATVGTEDNQNYVTYHRMHYQALCQGVERLTDGENASFLEIKGGHEYLVWYTSIYDALLLMF